MAALEDSGESVAPDKARQALTEIMAWVRTTRGWTLDVIYSCKTLQRTKVTRPEGFFDFFKGMTLVISRCECRVTQYTKISTNLFPLMMRMRCVSAASVLRSLTSHFQSSKFVGTSAAHCDQSLIGADSPLAIWVLRPQVHDQLLKARFRGC